MEGSGRKAPYYMQRGVPGSGLDWQGPPGFKPMLNVNAALQPTDGGGGGLGEAEYAAEIPALAVHGGGEAGMSTGELAKRKRGRPRKYGPEGDALSPSSGPLSDTATEKRGRGRPPGTGRKQMLATLGEWISGSAGTGFTPHVVIIETGEDIAARVMAFSQQGPRSVCILSANGALSKVTLHQSSSSGGTFTYEGRFEILSLSGSYTLTDDGNGHRKRAGSLSITVSNAEGNVVGGEVGGELIAATSVQLVVGSYLSERPKKKNKANPNPNTATAPATDPPAGDKLATTPDKPAGPTSPPPDHALTPTPTTNAWPLERHVDMRKPVDLTDG